MARKEQLFTCDVKSKYVMEVVLVENIEDCLDVVYTYEELKETFGIVDGHHSGFEVFENTLRQDLDVLYQKAKSDNKKFFDITDEMFEALKVSHKQFKEYLPYCTRRGKRVTLQNEDVIRAKQEVAETKKRNTDIAISLVYHVIYVFNKQHYFKIDIQQVRRDPKKALMFAKTLVRFEDLIVGCKSDENKKVWDNVESLEF